MNSLYPYPYPSLLSPVSGRININQVQSLTEDYVWEGNRSGIAQESPSLIDLKLDVVQIRNNLDKAPFVLKTATFGLRGSQALDELENGLISNLDGEIVSTTLTQGNLLIGDTNNKPSEIAVLPIDNLTNLSTGKFWQGDVDGRPVEVNSIPITDLNLPNNNIWIGNASNVPVPQQRINLSNLPSLFTTTLSDPTSFPPGATVNFGLNNLYTGGITIDPNNPTEPIVPTTTLRIDKSNLPNLSLGKVWMGRVNGTPPSITVDSSFPFIHVNGDLNWDVRGLLLDSYSVPQEVGLNPGRIFIGDPLFPGQITTGGLNPGQMFIGDITNPGGITSTGLLANQLFTGSFDNSGQIVKTTVLSLNNFPALPYTYLLMGDINNRPTAVQQFVIENFPDIPFNYLLMGDVNNRPSITETINLLNLPILTLGSVWVGDVNNRPIEMQLPEYAPLNAQYVLNTPNASLPEAQALDLLGIGLAKVSIGGLIGLAIPDEDYTDPATTEAIQEELVTVNDTLTSLGDSITTINSEITAIEGDVVTLGEEITVLNQVVTTATGEILQLQTLTATHTAEIATNTSNIATNTSNISTNTSNIANNTTNITNNTNNITNNTSSINHLDDAVFNSTFVVNGVTYVGINNMIGVVNNAIFAPVTGIFALVLANTTNINSNTQNISNNSTSISNINQNITNLSSQVTSNTSNIANNTSNITNLGNQVQDIVNIIIPGIPGATSATFTGNVSGSGLLSNPITLTINSTLDQIPLAAANVNMNSHSIYNVADIVTDTYGNIPTGSAVNNNWLLKFLNNEVI